MGAHHRRRLARCRPARHAARVRLAVRRSRDRRRLAGAVRRRIACTRDGCRSRSSKTTSRRCSIGVGATACRSCRRRRPACCACSTARSAPPTTSSPSFPPTSWSARSRRSRSTRCSPAASPSTCPVVLAAVEAACTDTFNMHGLLATTMPVGPVMIVNGPIRHRIGMNDGVNVLGQGNRANSTIGRALQLVIRNVGGGKPGGVDRATQGNPGKLSFCFPENEERSPWEPLHVERGFAADVQHRDAVPRRRSPRHRRPALPRSGLAGAVVRRVPAHRATSRSCRWHSTPSSS